MSERDAAGAVGDAERPPLVAVFCRAPVPGRAKTRLVPPLRADEAAALSAALLLDVLDALEAGPAEREACVADPHDAGAMRALVPPGVCVRAQGPGDLGERMLAVASARLAEGVPAVVLAGGDCPGLSARHVADALAALAAGADAALCPSGDGGYSLIAMTRPQPALFRDVPWGGERVMQATRARARRAGLALAELERVNDVDRPDDLRRLAARLAAAGAPSPAPRTWHALAVLGLLPRG